MTVERRVVVHVDLAGSRLGPGWHSVDVVVAPPDDWTDERVREEAARYYDIPLSQVGDPRPQTRADVDA
jgi:hypothetical protein